MSSAAWSPAANAPAASWSNNKALSDLQAAAITYNDPTVTYNSSLVYYNGYNPIGTTPEGEAGALWSEIAE